jgi:two-component system, NarL family, sensor kinase
MLLFLKNPYKFLFVFISVFSLHFQLFSQTEQTDSLLTELRENIGKHQATEMEINALRLLQISEENKDDKNRLEALKFMGIAQHLQARYDSAIFWHQKALMLGIETGDSTNTAKSYLNMATSYNSKGDFEKAVENALLSLEFFEKTGDTNGQGRVQNLLGIFNFNRNDFKSALQYFRKYNELAVAANDSGEIVSSMNNMSSALHELGEFKQERSLLKSVIAIQEARGQTIRIGSAYENLGTLFSDIDSLEQASFYFEKALDSYKLNNNSHDIARVLINTGLLKKKQKKYNAAADDYNQALQLSRDGGFLKLEEDVLKNLAFLYEEQKDYKNAFGYYTQFVAVKDSVLNKENQESINKLMIEFETEKKERQIAVQQLEIAEKTLQSRRKTLIIIGLIGIIIILLMFSFIIYSRIKIRQERRLNEERLNMKQLQMNVVLESQESERKRFARDLHDGFGQLITAVKIMLGQMQQTNEMEKRSELAVKSGEVLDTMHTQLREIAHNLMPDQLINEGLSTALKEYASRISKASGIAIEVNTFGIEKRLNQSVEVNVYRIIQEWINNVIKYSGAKNLTIQLTGYENEINIIIEDNGNGFEKEKLMKSKGWGWKNIQSRLEAINGILEIDTRAGVPGTSFIIDLPIA